MSFKIKTPEFRIVQTSKTSFDLQQRDYGWFHWSEWFVVHRYHNFESARSFANELIHQRDSNYPKVIWSEND